MHHEIDNEQSFSFLNVASNDDMHCTSSRPTESVCEIMHEPHLYCSSSSTNRHPNQRPKQLVCYCVNFVYSIRSKRYRIFYQRHSIQGSRPHPRKNSLSDNDKEEMTAMVTTQLQFLATHENITIPHELMYHSNSRPSIYLKKSTYSSDGMPLFTDITPTNPKSGLWLLSTTSEVHKLAVSAVEAFMDDVWSL